MNTQLIRKIVIILLVVFAILIGISINLHNKNNEISNLRIKLNNTIITAKTRDIALGKIYYSILLDYKDLDKCNSDFIKQIDNLSKTYPHINQIKKLQYIALDQDKQLELIKDTNSIFYNSFYTARDIPINFFNKYYKYSKDDKNTIRRIRRMSRFLLDMIYDIKISSIYALNSYKDMMDELEKLKIHNTQLKIYKNNFLKEIRTIYHTTNILHKASNKYGNLNKTLNQYYNKLDYELNNRYKKFQTIIFYIMALLAIVTISFVSLIFKLIIIEKWHKDKEQKSNSIIDKNIITTTTDINGILIDVSEAFCKISGYKKNELVGSSFSKLKDKYMSCEIFDSMWKTISQGNIWEGEIRNINKSGDYFWLYCTIEPVVDKNNNIIEFFSINKDITNTKKLKETLLDQKLIIDIKTQTAHKQRDKAIEASKAKSEFLANMSHEIRTPLNAIMGFINILKEETKGRKTHEYIEIIDQSSKVLLQIIEDILDFSKIESGKLVIDKINFDPKKELSLIEHLFQAQCSKKNINLTINFDDDIPKVIYTDLLRVKQIITNLLSNAVKFTNNGKNIEVDVKYRNNNLIVSVKDEGKGIAKDKIDHIFEAFNQEDNSTTRKYGGTGLGLSISSKLAKLLGGNLKVTSELGKGSIFSLIIPAPISNINLKNNTKDINIDFTNKKILLVEDNKANQMFMKVILKKMKLKFEIASDGVQAVEKFKNNSYDLILMDENMPNMSGIEATQHIRKYEKENNLTHTPIVALTANALKGDREKFLSSGMDEYLTKPLNKNKLVIILNKIF